MPASAYTVTVLYSIHIQYRQSQADTHMYTVQIDRQIYSYIQYIDLYDNNHHQHIDAHFIHSSSEMSLAVPHTVYGQIEYVSVSE